MTAGAGWPRSRRTAVLTEEKRLAAAAAAKEVQPGMIVGLGTGSTVAELIPILAGRVADGLAITCVATSEATTVAARAAGMTVVPFDDCARVDLTIDGVDEIDASLRAIKGGGGAQLREKIVATASRRMIAIADSSKFSEGLGGRPVPVEILPFARAFVVAAIEAMGAVVTLRGPVEHRVVSDQGNLLADCVFPAPFDADGVAAGLAAVPGLLGHGLFLGEIDALYLARGGRVERFERPPAPGSA